MKSRLNKKLLPKVALRKESVDRNVDKRYEFRRHNGSLSARRAWIEIQDT